MAIPEHKKQNPFKRAGAIALAMFAINQPIISNILTDSEAHAQTPPAAAVDKSKLLDSGVYEPLNFPQTGQSIQQGQFIEFFNQYGLQALGYPIGKDSQRVSPINGKSYLMQDFERTSLELHPEYAGTEYEVSLSQLGTILRNKLYPEGVIPKERQIDVAHDPSAAHEVKVDGKTSYWVPNDVYDWWIRMGGGTVDGAIRLLGLPLHNGLIKQKDPTNGKEYETVMFERTWAERQPGKAYPYNVEGALLGDIVHDIDSGKLNIDPYIWRTATPTPTVDARPTATATATPRIENPSHLEVEGRSYDVTGGFVGGETLAFRDQQHAEAFDKEYVKLLYYLNNNRKGNESEIAEYQKYLIQHPGLRNKIQFPVKPPGAYGQPPPVVAGQETSVIYDKGIEINIGIGIVPYGDGITLFDGRYKYSIGATPEGRLKIVLPSNSGYNYAVGNSLSFTLLDLLHATAKIKTSDGSNNQFLKNIFALDGEALNTSNSDKIPFEVSTFLKNGGRDSLLVKK